jgi:hypothetical protein
MTTEVDDNKAVDEVKLLSEVVSSGWLVVSV